ncbi:hypothetical protein B0H16DRAFT_1744531 [Mycena metata]|uniref:Ribonuclease H1 N-terminal domain-containing protein n=1 Tax=Mycena metata TaxID=1033252 RepID=A0AAD7H534_9AGAR|nr:hypothetical protein B0H16DRAFT_1744531 [Mycena metata]
MASSPSTTSRRLTRVNLRTDELIMDTRGAKDARYYCLPPVYGEPSPTKGGGGYPLHLVAQGHVVGVFHKWVEAKVQLTGFPDSINRGYHTMEEFVDACGHIKMAAYPAVKREKREDIAGQSAPSNSQLLADLKQYCRPIRDDSPRGGNGGGSSAMPPRVNFTIRGAGIVSSSAQRSQERYLELQRRGEEPDMLVTRSLGAASLFALDEGGDEGEDSAV